MTAPTAAQRRVLWSVDDSMPRVVVARHRGRTIGAILNEGAVWSANVDSYDRGGFGWEGGIQGKFPTEAQARAWVEGVYQAGRAAVAAPATRDLRRP